MCPSPGKPFLAGSWVLANQPLPREEVTSANSQRAYRHGAASYQKTVLPPQPSATSTNLIQRLLICPTLETKKNYTAAESEILPSSRHPDGLQQPLLARKGQHFRASGGRCARTCQGSEKLNDSGRPFGGSFSTSTHLVHGI